MADSASVTLMSCGDIAPGYEPTEQIAELGGWDIAQGVIEVDKDNNERTLAPGEVLDIKPGQGFGKKHRWKRG